MPKPTFLNLPAEKRDAFVRIALEEFAERLYEAASVTRIVAQAGIAKGSVYQYFEDKEDLFRFLIAHASETLTAAIVSAVGALPPDAGLFAQLRVFLRANLRAAHAQPLHARLIQRAFSTAASPGSPGADMITAGNAERETRLHALFEAARARGELRADLSSAIASYALNQLLSHLPDLIAAQLGRPLADIDPAELDTPEVRAIVDGVMVVLSEGLRARKGSEGS
jgi:AcrR family transcriptional regulator